VERTSILPHPSPLPLGEGKAIARRDYPDTHPANSDSGDPSNGRRFSLSQRERAGVRESLRIDWELRLRSKCRGSYKPGPQALSIRLAAVRRHAPASLRSRGEIRFPHEMVAPDSHSV